MAKKRVTLADVARLAGVSQTAASFVLSGRREDMRISADVEARVLHAVRVLGYRPNAVSRSLRTGTTHTIGLVSDTISTAPFAGHLIWGALDAAREHGYLLFIAESEGDPELEQELVQAMVDRQVDGIVLASMYTRALLPPKSLGERPSILLNAVPARPKPIVSVVPDEIEGGRTAARALLEAGHREGIGLIGVGPGRTRTDSLAAIERFQGIEEVFTAEGIDIAAAVGCDDWQPHHGWEATHRLLKEVRELSALICFNDRLALGAYQALADAGLRVPDDVSVVSFDDDIYATWVRPPLTTVALPHYELGRTAVELLLKEIRGERRPAPGRYRIRMPLRERGSIRPRFHPA
ncbi:MAG: LacI family DNA-binding transcriptional regulator [Acidothermus cellulolyticus]|jgi:LacI family transcriptional regulator|nr:LacI family DNA-binding transcriptional regulator [Acidothermus cellulolyticus]